MHEEVEKLKLTSGLAYITFRLQQFSSSDPKFSNVTIIKQLQTYELESDCFALLTEIVHKLRKCLISLKPWRSLNYLRLRNRCEKFVNLATDRSLNAE